MRFLFEADVRWVPCVALLSFRMTQSEPSSTENASNRFLRYTSLMVFYGSDSCVRFAPRCWHSNPRRASCLRISDSLSPPWNRSGHPAHLLHFGYCVDKEVCRQSPLYELPKIWSSPPRELRDLQSVGLFKSSDKYFWDDGVVRV